MKRNAFAGLVFAGVIHSAVAAVAEPAGISDALRAPPDEQPAFVLNAQGAQIYVCKARSDDPGVYGWVFVAPEATLLEKGEKVGHHGSGPIWESASDGSSVKGAVRQRQDGGAGNIPWLLLSGTPSGAGRFAGVTSIQRVATRGGTEPGTQCDAAMAGREAQVEYTADYFFYKRRDTSKPAGY